jgi:hypothetical protein
MSTTVEIGDVGERLVSRWLAEHGYSPKIDTRGPGSTDIEARGNKTSLLVQVKTTLAPAEPHSMTPDEEKGIKARAARLGCQAWEARVQVNQQMQQVGEIRWRKLG